MWGPFFKAGSPAGSDQVAQVLIQFDLENGSTEIHNIQEVWIFHSEGTQVINPPKLRQDQ